MSLKWTLLFNVDQQTLTRTDTAKLVADSRNYVYAHFTFSAGWDDLSKVAQFTRRTRPDVTYDVNIVDDECLVPWEVLVGEGDLEINVFGGDLATTAPCVVHIYASGLKDGELPEEPTPGAFDEILTKLLHIGDFTEYPLKNLPINADFSGGTEGWSGSGVNLSAADGVCSATGTGTTQYPQMYQTISDACVAGHKIYGKMRVRVTNNACTQIVIYVYKAGGTSVVKVIFSPVESQWYDISHIFTQIETGNLRVLILHQYADAATATNKVMEIGTMIVTDLTSDFGSGNEPGTEFMEDFTGLFPNDWFDNLSYKELIDALITMYGLPQNRISPTIVSGWSNYSTESVSYIKRGKTVNLRGALAGGATGTTPFTFTVGNRPPQKMRAITYAYGIGWALAEIRTTGEIYLYFNGSPTYVSLDNIHFDVE